MVPTVLGFLFWFAGTARTTGTQAALFTAFAPTSAILFAVLLFGDSLTPARLAGLLLVVAGVLLGATGPEEPRPFLQCCRGDLTSFSHSSEIWRRLS